MSQRSVAPVTTRREPVTAVAPGRWWLRESSAGVFEHTTDPALATHTLERDGAGGLVRAPLASATDPVTLARAGNVYLVMGG